MCRWRCTCAPNSHVEIRGHSWLWVLSFHCDTGLLLTIVFSLAALGACQGCPTPPISIQTHQDHRCAPPHPCSGRPTLLLILQQHDTGPSLQPVFQVLLLVWVSTPQHMCGGQRALDGISSLLLLLCGFTELTSVRFFSASVYPLSHLASPLPIFSSSFSL